MRNVKKSPVVILFIVAAVLYAIIYILPQVTGVCDAFHGAFQITAGKAFAGVPVDFLRKFGQLLRVVRDRV